jgi:hypothetical protein
MTEDFDQKIRVLLAAAIKNCKTKSRDQIAEEMERLYGHEITLSVLYDCTRPKTPGGVNRFRAAWVPLLCAVVGNDKFARGLLSERTQQLIEIGELCVSSCGSLESALAQVKALQGTKQQTKR